MSLRLLGSPDGVDPGSSAPLAPATAAAAVADAGGARSHVVPRALASIVIGPVVLFLHLQTVNNVAQQAQEIQVLAIIRIPPPNQPPRRQPQ